MFDGAEDSGLRTQAQFGRHIWLSLQVDGIHGCTLSPVDLRPPNRRRARCYVGSVATEGVLNQLRQFVDERDWAQFHTPENLAKSIAIEAGELLECYQWGAGADEQAVEAELADVLTYALLLADRLGADPEEIILRKLALTRDKYPIHKARGRSTKYDQL